MDSFEDYRKVRRKEKDIPKPSKHPVEVSNKTDEELQLLKQFDLNAKFGPCIGMSRLDRWERAESLGLHPPPEIQFILLNQHSSNYTECLWKDENGLVP